MNILKSLVLVCFVLLFGFTSCYLDVNDSTDEDVSEQKYVEITIDSGQVSRLTTVNEYGVTSIIIIVTDPSGNIIQRINWDADQGSQTHRVPVTQMGQHGIRVTNIAADDGEHGDIVVDEYSTFNIQPMIITVINIIPGAVAIINIISEPVTTGLPDLVVRSLEVTGTAMINTDNSVEIPVRVTIQNQGTAAAGIFKTSMAYTSSVSTFVVEFTVPGQSDMWYPHTSAPLGTGSAGIVVFDGMLTFHPSLHNENVSLVATADSCSGDEFMPDYCRVNESDEGNNDSSAINVFLP